MAASPEKSEQDYRAESDMRTLSDAEEIRGDRPRHAAARKVAGKKAACYANVAKGGRSMGKGRR